MIKNRSFDIKRAQHIDFNGFKTHLHFVNTIHTIIKKI